MGEDIFNFVLSDISGIPSLPVFIGNYLLDLLSAFFPIFIILSSFVMVYIGFTRGSGDWKQTGQQIAPTAVSIAVIMGLLSMKTPYTSSDGANLDGNFWQDTNSYTVVEMMNTFLGFGNIFADALTHKIIYGSIDVSDSTGDNGFNGYFPAVLQAMIDRNAEKSRDMKEFLKDETTNSNIYDEVMSKYNSISASTKIISKNLYYLGVIDNHTKIRNGAENVVDSISSYSNLKSKEYITSAKSETGSYLSFNYPTFFMSEGQIDEINSTSKNGAEDRNMKQDKVLIPHLTLFKENGEKDEIAIQEQIKQFASTDLSNISAKIKPEQLLSYLSKDNFQQEALIIQNVYKIIEVYVTLYEKYESAQKTLDSSKFEDKEAKAELNKLYLDYEKRKRNILAHIEEAVALEIDLSEIYKLTSGKEASLSGGTIEALIKRVGMNYNDNSLKDRAISAAEKNAIVNSFNSVLKDTIPADTHEEKDLTRDATITKVLNNMMRNRAYFTNIAFDKYKDLLKQDTIFNASMGFPLQTPFTVNFFNENKVKALVYLDNKKKQIIDEYWDSTGGTDGKVNVAAKLKKSIEEQQSNSELGAGKIIHWTDLGKHYATFKNLFSPMMTNIYAMEKMNNADVEKIASLAKLMEELEPSNKISRLTNVAAVFAGGKFALGVSATAKNLLNKAGEDKSKKATSSSFSSFWDAIKIIGGVYFAIFFVNVVLPAFVWMFAIVTYYIEMSMYVAVFPIGFMFMIFQSYRQSLHQYINMLLGFILMPIILVSMYFVVLYIDMLLPMFFKQFMPFFGSYSEFSNAFSVAFGSQTGLLDSLASDVIGGAGEFIDKTMTDIKNIGIDNSGSVKDISASSDLIQQIGNFIYTILSLLMSALLLMTFFRANEYMSKILNVSTVGGMDAFQGRETINKFGSFDKSGMTAGIIGR